jgi:hypothetical protein
VAEGGGLLNRYRGLTSIVSSNLIPSAKQLNFQREVGRLRNGTRLAQDFSWRLPPDCHRMSSASILAETFRHRPSSRIGMWAD